MKSGYSLNYYFILQTDSSGGKNHTMECSFEKLLYLLVTLLANISFFKIKWSKNIYIFIKKYVFTFLLQSAVHTWNQVLHKHTKTSLKLELLHDMTKHVNNCFTKYLISYIYKSVFGDLLYKALTMFKLNLNFRSLLCPGTCVESLVRWNKWHYNLNSEFSWRIKVKRPFITNNPSKVSLISFRFLFLLKLKVKKMQWRLHSFFSFWLKLYCISWRGKYLLILLFV